MTAISPCNVCNVCGVQSKRRREQAALPPRTGGTKFRCVEMRPNAPSVRAATLAHSPTPRKSSRGQSLMISEATAIAFLCILVSTRANRSPDDGAFKIGCIFGLIYKASKMYNMKMKNAILLANISKF